MAALWNSWAQLPVNLIVTNGLKKLSLDVDAPYTQVIYQISLFEVRQRIFLLESINRLVY
jgi:hypothetical protein